MPLLERATDDDRMSDQPRAASPRAQAQPAQQTNALPSLRYVAPNPHHAHPESSHLNLCSARNHDVCAPQAATTCSASASASASTSATAHVTTDDQSLCRLICVGNPGVGKSALLNCLIGAPVFPSGTSLVHGLTTTVHTHATEQSAENGDHGFLYVDTPGVDDITSRYTAALEISKALSCSESRIRLLFVVTLEAGRVRPSDLATLDFVVSALDDAGIPMAGKYSVVINKCEQGVVHRLEAFDVAHRDVLAHFNYICHVTHVATLPICEAAAGAEDVLLPFQDSLRRFVDEAPEFCTPRDFEVLVDIHLFDKRVDQLVREAALLRRELAVARRREAERGVGGQLADGLGIAGDLSELASVGSDIVGKVARFVGSWLHNVGQEGMRVLRLS